METVEESVRQAINSMHQQTEDFVRTHDADPTTHTLAKWPVQEHWAGDWLVYTQVVALVPSEDMMPGRDIRPDGYPHTTIGWKMKVGTRPNLPPALPAEFLTR